MFNWFFKPAKQVDTSARDKAISRKATTRDELAVRASIAAKLQNYDSSQDTNTSHFTLGDDKPGNKRESTLSHIAVKDAWGQADPREAGRWKKENRRMRL